MSPVRSCCLFLVFILCTLPLPAAAGVVNATWGSATDVPVTASSYTGTGSTVNFTLNFAPATGTNLTVVNNTGLPFISGTFDNLAQGQAVALSYGGVTYNYVAHYYGGTGNDLVLVWANQRVFGWGSNLYGDIGDGTSSARPVMVPTTTNGVLAGKTICALVNDSATSIALCSDGTLAAWGLNYFGNIGNYTTTDSYTPTLVNTASGVSALYGKTVVAIALGGCSMALCSDGTVAAWGYNSYGNIGDNTTYQRNVPVAVNTTNGVSALYGKTVVAIAAGSYHCMALCSDGTLATWGQNNFGQLGNNSTTNSSVPVLVNMTGISALHGKTVSAIAVGSYFSMALCTDGTVATWGDGYYGELGNNNMAFSLVPVTVSTTNGVSALYGKTVVSVAAGYSHALALCSDGTVAAWGSNNYGQLGDNSTVQRNAPVLVNNNNSALNGKTVAAITIGGNNKNCSRALCTDGTVAAWGYNADYSLGNNSTVNSIVPLPVNTTPLAAGETIVTPSSGSQTALSLALVAEPAPTLTTLPASPISSTTAVLNGTVNPNGGSAAASFDYGLTTSYGSTIFATPGAVSGSTVSAVSATPAGLAPLTTYHFRIKCGIYYGSDQTFTTISNNADLANVLLSSGTMSPAFIPGSTFYNAIVSSDTSSVTVTPSVADPNATVTVNGTAVAAGSASGAINLVTGDNAITLQVTAQDGTTTKVCRLVVSRMYAGNLTATYSSANDVPLSINGFSTAGSTLNLGLNYAPATGTNLTVVSNTGSGFINGTFSNLAQGQTVTLNYNGVTYTYAANYYGGTGNDLVLVWAASRIFAWGDNSSGQIGDGTTVERDIMVPVPATATASGMLAGKTITALAQGPSYSLALCSDGTIAAWGSNNNGQLGNNTTTDSSVPVLVNTANGVSALYGKTVVAIAAGSGCSMALCSDGTVATWGWNYYGQLGNNGTASSSVPVAVNTTSGVSALNGRTVVAIAAGDDHCLALCSDGTLAAWGDNTYGQFGNNSTTSSLVPVLVNTDNGVSALYGKTVKAVAAGRSISMALCTDSTVVNWGGNNTRPVAVSAASPSSALYGKTVTAIAAGYGSFFALGTDGTIAAWGANNNGQLGDTTTTTRSIPVAVNTDSGLSALYGKSVVAIAACSFAYDSRALCSDGTLATWGAANFGYLGNNSTADQYAPTAVITSPISSVETFVSPASGANTALSMILVAAPPLTLTTLAATSVGGTSAVLNGTTTPSNGITLSFDYGSTAAYGNSLAATSSTAAADGTTPVTAVLSGLSPNTTYHYRINGGGGYVGSDQTFTTLNNDASLSSLTTSAGILSPAFDSGTFSYSTPDVSSVTDSITVTPTLNDGNALAQINGVSVPSGSPYTLSLGYGKNIISTVVTAQDGTTAQTYSITVRRLPPATFAAAYSSATDVPMTSNELTATGSTVNFTLNYAPATGTNLTVVNNTALSFINGTFDNLAQGQAVVLSYNGVNYHFVANYYGGTGNDLVLVWASNRVFAWGYNNDGELGDGTTTSRPQPVAVSAAGVLTGKTVIAASQGYNHALVLCSDGTVAAWGDNTYGQLGNNSVTASSVPTAVNAISGVSALYGKTVIAVTAGSSYSMALCSDGTLVAWGYNNSGQLGDGTTTQRNVPVAVNTSSGVSALYGKSVVAVSAGSDHALALCSDGTVASWGNNFSGILGDNSFTTRLVPVAVNTDSGISALYGKTVVAVSAGLHNSMALCSDGTVTTWGYSALGDSTPWSYIPMAVNTVSGVSALYGKTVVAVSAGLDYDMALCSDGTLAGWGDNYYGQLGSNAPANQFVPFAVNTASGVSALYGKAVVNLVASQYHCMVQCADGTLAAWGLNAYGEVGDKTTTQRNAPVMVSSSALVAGQQFSFLPGSSKAYEWTLALVAAPASAAVGTQAAAAISSTSTTLNGTVVAAYSNMDVSFEYGTTTAYGSTATATPTPVSGGFAVPVSSNLTGLQPSTTYHFRVNGVVNGTTINGNDQTFTTLSNNANLANLVPSTGTLSPVFAAGTFS